MRTKLPLFSFIFILGLFFQANQSFAQAPRRYYDWSSTIETTQSRVLGVQAVLQEATGSAVQPSVSTTPITTAPVASVKDFHQFDRYLLGGNLTPDNPFHFLKPLQENIQLTLTFNPVAKEALRVEIAGERLSEMHQLAEENKTSGLAQAASSYENSMEEVADALETLKEQKTDVSTLLKTVEEETAKHNVVLEEVAVKVPDQAKEGIEKALVASQHGTDVVADLSGRPAVPPDVVDRIQALKAQGLLTEEEAGKLINAKTRSEARTELRKYVQEGVVPEADFMRMNENVKQLYPDDFYKIHEVKRFYEMKRLESEKPDDSTLAKVQEFAKTYKSGEVVPGDIRRYWVPVVRLEELQNTLRPDLIDDKLFKNNQGDLKKFNEVVERFKPRPEDIAYMKTFIEKNNTDVSSLPPEYQRMYTLGQRYGAQCGAGQRWVPAPQTGGYCAPEGSTLPGGLPKTEDFARGKSCVGTVTAAKGPGGACTAYPSDCIPPGWSASATCIETPQLEEIGIRNTGNPLKRISCPSNAHFVPVPYSPDGGYCIPNITPTDVGSGTTSQAGVACQAGYHRNYSGGPCLPDYTSTGFTTSSLPPLTFTPGQYPSPQYPSAGKCGQGSHFVPEPINPSGGYCAPDNYSYTKPGGRQGTLPAGPQPTVTFTDPNSGKAVSCSGAGDCYDKCKTNPGLCSGFNPNSPRPSEGSTGGNTGGTPGSGYGSCPSGMRWNGSYCMGDSSTNYSGSGQSGTGTNPYSGGTSGRTGTSWQQQYSSGTSGTGTQTSGSSGTSGGGYQPPSGGYQAPYPYSGGTNYQAPAPTDSGSGGSSTPPPSGGSSSPPAPSSDSGGSSAPPPSSSSGSGSPPAPSSDSGGSSAPPPSSSSPPSYTAPY